MSVFKLMRIVMLLSILFVIVVSAWMTEKRMAAWERPILVTVYPIVADDRASTRRFAEALNEASFDPVNAFFTRASVPYGFTVTPAVRIQLAEVSDEKPPKVPAQFDTAAIGWWSLKMRWWAFMQSLRDGLVTPDIQMFVLFHSLNGNDEVGISVGMRKGRYGIVKAYARDSLADRNLVVFTHELLHVLGATDKYVLTTGEPLYPEGYADPNQRPLFPQARAEIMGGRIPLSSIASAEPESLAECHIGQVTAQEIGFFDKLNAH